MALSGDVAVHLLTVGEADTRHLSHGGLKDCKSSRNQNIKQTKMRKAKPKKRVILPDPVFHDVKVTKFVSKTCYDLIVCKRSLFLGCFRTLRSVFGTTLGTALNTVMVE